jgi:hypothetical protein
MLTVAVAIALMAGRATAMSVRRVGLETLVQRADRVFVGRCVAVEEVVGGWNGLPITEATFVVIEPLKPAPSAEHASLRSGDHVTMRQLGGLRVPGLDARFAVGQETLLFLHRESEAGLTSPVGAGQGRFSIIRQAGPRADLAVTDLAPLGLRSSNARSGGAVGRSVMETDHHGLSEARHHGVTAAHRDGAMGKGVAVELAPLLRAVRLLVEEGGNR